MLGVKVKEEENGLLATHQGLLKENAKMKVKVDKAEKRLMELSTHLQETTKARELLEAGRVEFNEQWKGSGKGSISAEERGSQETTRIGSCIACFAVSPCWRGGQGR